jgi:hypothetical protein
MPAVCSYPALKTALGTGHLRKYTRWLAEVTPVRGDDEKQPAESERDARDDPSRDVSLQRRDFGGDESGNPTSAMITPI